MFGLHFYYDLIRLSRKPRHWLLRCGYLLALLLGWWFVYGQVVSGSIDGHQDSVNLHASLASSFARTVVIFQYVLVFVLTPIYLAGTIIEEKENRTLELLFQTDLKDHEILLGKFAARVVHLMSLLLLSLPPLAIISLWGGIDVAWLAMHFALVMLLLIFAGSVSLFASVNASAQAEAVGLAYATEFAFGAACLGVMRMGWDITTDIPCSEPYLVLGGSLLVLGLSYFFYTWARIQFGQLRDMKWAPHLQSPPPRTRPRRRTRRKSQTKQAAMTDHALFWKEVVRHGPVPDDAFLILAWFSLLCIGVGTICLLLWVLGPDVDLRLDEKRRGAQTIFFLYYIVLATTVSLTLALSTTPCIAREREQNTLDFLLLLPVERYEILFIKWIAPWVRIRLMLTAMVALPLLGLLLGVFSLRSALLTLLLPWPSLLMVNFLSLLLSVVCQRVMRANVILVVSLLAVLFAHLLCWDEFVQMCHGYAILLTDADPADQFPLGWDRVLWLIGLHQGLILLSAQVLGGLAFWCFSRKTSEVRTQVW
jgi:ABC-type transport system involved in multi-copper enzyme maturation permease subunit